MARNSSGTYSLPSGNPVVSGTTITSSWSNTTLSDIATEITDSLDRYGRGAMLAALKVVDGTSSAPGLAFSSEQTSGLYRAGSADVRLAVSSTDVLKATSSSFTIDLAATALKGLTVTQSTTNGTGGTFTGNGTGGGVVGTGGSTGAGGAFTGGASGATGVSGTGTGSHVGGLFTGGATNAAGVISTGGGTGEGARLASGTDSTASTPQNALVLTNGHLDMSGAANPNSDVAFLNQLTPMNLVKAWGRVHTDGLGGATLVSGFNVTSVAVAGSTSILVTLASAMADANYGGVATGAAGVGACFLVANTATTLNLQAIKSDASGSVTFNNTVTTMTFVVFGAQ